MVVSKKKFAEILILNGLATFWATYSQKHLVALNECQLQKLETD
jgi:hypothetical protein